MMTNEQVKTAIYAKVVPALLGGGVGAYVAIRMLSEVPPWIQHLIENQGSDFLVVVVFLGMALLFGPSFIRSQQDMAVAFSGIKDQMQIMNSQAGKLDEIKGMIEDLNLNQHVIIDRLRNMERASAQHDTREP